MLTYLYISQQIILIFLGLTDFTNNLKKQLFALALPTATSEEPKKLQEPLDTFLAQDQVRLQPQADDITEYDIASASMNVHCGTAVVL